MDPDAPTVTENDTAEDGADGAVATTRTVWAPPSSPTDDNATSDVSVKLNETEVLSVIVNSAPVTVTAEPPTEADPDKATVSAVSTTPSSRAVISNDALPLNDPAGIDTMNMSLVAPVVKSPEAPSVAPFVEPPATVTVTSVADVNTDDDPANSAVTVTDCAALDSRTDDVDNDNEISASSSVIVNTPPV